MDDISQNIRDDRQEPYRPSHSEVREWAEEQLRDGLEPDRDREGEPMGPEFDGFAATLREVRDMYSGTFTEEEFREIARDAFEASIADVLDDEETTLDEDAHRTLDSFEGYEARLAFDSTLVDALLDGRKTATVRYDLEPGRLEPGTRALVVTSGRKSPVAVAYVEDVIRTDLGDALRTIEDRGYQHNENRVVDLWKALENYYEDSFGLSTTVSVVLLDDITTVGT